METNFVTTFYPVNYGNGRVFYRCKVLPVAIETILYVSDILANRSWV